MNSSDGQECPLGGEFSPDGIKRILRTAVDYLYQSEPDIDVFASEIDKFHPETTQTEWNLVAHLAPGIAKFFGGYSYDIDVMKPNYENRRPDIIIHKRGTNKHNLLVIEVKKDRPEREIRSDASKIREYWFRGNLQYQFGATINLRGRGNLSDISVFDNPPR